MSDRHPQKLERSSSEPAASSSHGGRRPGAGRKPTSDRRPIPHRRRPEHLARHPVHVTFRSRLRSLRTQFVFPTLRSVFADVNRAERKRPHARSALRDDFRIVHFSVQSNHLHLLVEARDKRALSNGLRGLAVSVTRRLNQLVSRRGRVFSDRWHGRALTTSRAVRHALVYVIANFRKHRPSDTSPIDVYSSAPYFVGFAGLRGRSPIARDPALLPRALAPPSRENPTRVEPSTWLLSAGWRQHGAIRLADAPRPELRR